MAPPPDPSSSTSSSQQPLPRDARVIALILASKGIDDTTPQVLHQLLEFAHRYTTDILLDALTYSEHAGKGGKLDVDDLSLAVQAKVNWSFKEGGERDFLIPLAQSVNSNPLPPVPETPFLRLPSARDLLTAPNFNLVPNKPPAGYGTSLLDGGSSHGGSSGGESGDDDDDDDDDEDDDGTPRPTKEGGEDADEEDEDEDMEEMMLQPVQLDLGPPPVSAGGSGLGEKRRMADEEDDDYDA